MKFDDVDFSDELQSVFECVDSFFRQLGEESFDEVIVD
jgi:hypothetical protein